MTERSRRISAAVTIAAVLVVAGLGVIATTWTATALIPRTSGLHVDRAGTAAQAPSPRAVASLRRSSASRLQAADTRLARGTPPDLKTVIANITHWLVGMLVALATLFLTIGGIRYLFAGGDPSEVGKAKDTLKYAGIGYCIAVLAPVLVKILQGFVGAG